MNTDRIKYEKLASGFEFNPSSFIPDRNTVDLFLKAIEDDHAIYNEGIVPPMAIAAFAMKALMEQFELLPGTVHTSQQFSFQDIVKVGEKLTSYAKVSRKIARGKFHMLSVNIVVRKENNNTALTGEMGFVLPLLKEK